MKELIENCTDSSTFVEIDVEMVKIPEVREKMLGMNPFTQELVIECTKIIDPVAMVRCEDGTMLPATSTIEKQKAVRLYRLAGAKERAMNLSVSALRMFVYIQYTIKAAKDWIQMTPDQYARSVGKGGRNAYKKAVDELHRYGYISPAVQKHVYWVNPTLLYAGSRKTKWPEKVIVKNTWSPDRKDEMSEEDQMK